MAAMYDVSYNNIVVEMNGKKTDYRAQFYIETDEDLALYELPYGSTPYWAPEGTDLFLTYSKRWSLKGNHTAPYLLEQKGSSGVTASGAGGSLTSQYEYGYSSVPYPIPLQYVGARRATAADEKAAKFSIETEAACKEGQVIYANAGTEAAGPVGSVVPSLTSDFAATNHPTYEFINSGRKLNRLSIRFYSSTSAHSLARILEKTNGSFAAAFEPNDHATARWLCNAEEISRVVDGASMVTKVERTFIEAPGTATWNTTKYPAWTTWS